MIVLAVGGVRGPHQPLKMGPLHHHHLGQQSHAVVWQWMTTSSASATLLDYIPQSQDFPVGHHGVSKFGQQALTNNARAFTMPI